jgi:nitrogen fixation/metabolism regulation signal transduction histidine kinase
MVYKRFWIALVLLQILLAITLFLLVWTLFRTHMLITSVNLALLAVAEITYLIYFINKTNRDLTRFFDAFRFHDGTYSFNPPKNKGDFNLLYHSFENLLVEFRNLRTSLEKEKFFYLNALNHIGVGLLMISQDGTVRFGNRAVQKMVESGQVNSLKDLNRLKPGLATTLAEMSPNSKELIKVVLHHEVVQLSVRCSMFRIDNELFRIFSFQDIKDEMEKNEAEAWQKLIRILTHEIMNSVSPITLTSSGIIQVLEKEGKPREIDEIDRGTLDRVLLGLQAIRKRSKGLASFVENYNAINHLPQPLLTLIPVSGLFSQVEVIMKEELLKNQVQLELIVAPSSLVLHADERLISQVLINLIRNAMQAMEGIPKKQIKLSAFQADEQVRISVTDNGKGISTELLDSVFVPFYTTREKGSGIGLSLSREIMKQHGGGIRVHSVPGKETTFTLVF